MGFVDIERPEMVSVLPEGKSEPILVAKRTQERFPERFPLHVEKQAEAPSEQVKPVRGAKQEGK